MPQQSYVELFNCSPGVIHNSRTVHCTQSLFQQERDEGIHT